MRDSGTIAQLDRVRGTGPEPIRLTIRGPQAWVAGEVADLVKPVVLQYGPDEGAAERHILANPLDGSEVFCFPVGLVQRVLQHLEGQGHGVEIENLMHYPALERFRERLAGCALSRNLCR